MFDILHIYRYTPKEVKANKKQNFYATTKKKQANLPQRDKSSNKTQHTKNYTNKKRTHEENMTNN